MVCIAIETSEAVPDLGGERKQVVIPEKRLNLEAELQIQEDTENQTKQIEQDINSIGSMFKSLSRMVNVNIEV